MPKIWPNPKTIKESRFFQSISLAFKEGHVAEKGFVMYLYLSWWAVKPSSFLLLLRKDNIKFAIFFSIFIAQFNKFFGRLRAKRTID